MVGFVPELPVPLLVRRDWPGFPAPKKKRQSRQRCGRARTPRVALMAQEDEEVVDTKGESSAPAAHTLLSLSQQVIQEENREQKQDDPLKHCWSHLQEVKG